MITEGHRCAICSAEFGSSKDLVHHERGEHSHHADGSHDTPLPEPAERGRKNREFSRRNTE